MRLPVESQEIQHESVAGTAYIVLSNRKCMKTKRETAIIHSSPATACSRKEESLSHSIILTKPDEQHEVHKPESRKAGQWPPAVRSPSLLPGGLWAGRASGGGASLQRLEPFLTYLGLEFCH